MDATHQVNSVDRTDGKFMQGQFGANGYETTGGQRPVPPPCPPPWSPLSPAYNNISPQMAAHRQSAVPTDRIQGPFGMSGSRQFLSAVPMGAYGSSVVQTPMGTSPSGNCFLANVVAHQSVMPCSVRGSPGALQPQPPMHPGQYGASPALSDTSSRLSTRMAGGVNQAMQSPRAAEPMLSNPPRVGKGPAQEPGRCQQGTQYSLTGGSPHQACQVMSMYPSSNTMMNTAPGQGQTITNMMATTHLGASPRSQTYMAGVQEQPPHHASQAAGPPSAAYAAAGSVVQVPVYPLQQQTSGKAAAQPPPPAKHDWSSVMPRPSPPVVSPRANTEGQASAAAPVCTPPVATRAHAQAVPMIGQRTTGSAAAWSMSGVKQPSSGYPGVALTPAQTLNRYGGVNALTEFEQGEVLHYPQVYYVGAGANKHCPHPSQPENNRGFDDDRGDYRPIAHDHLAYRFEIISILGKGSFGQVLKCYDYKDQVLRAVKIIRNKTRFHQQARVELKILHHLVTQDKNDSNHVIHIVDSFEFRGHLCICFELLSHNLYEFMRLQDFKRLNSQLVHKFASQLICTLCFLKQEGVIHCDLKPENILLQNCHYSAIKVIDFGSSCYRNKCVYTYIQSRFYRSPEVILGMKYGHEIDMWSLGCILCELATGKALFPGENEQHQLSLFMEVLGLPPPSILKSLASVSKVKGRVQVDNSGMIKLVPDSHGRMPRPGSRRLSSILRHQKPKFVDLVSCMLEWDPAKRITPEEAKRHTWISQPEGPAQDISALRTSAQQQEPKLKAQDVNNRHQGHDGQIRAIGGLSEARASRGPLTEAGNVQISLHHGEKCAPKPAAGALSSKASHLS
eukprot:jgi/Ulvmu1/8306/UM042_0011.1